VTERAHWPPVKLGTVSLRAVLYDDEVVRPGEFHDGLHVGRPAGQVHHYHGLGPRADDPGDARGGDVAAVTVYIGENGLGSLQHDGAGRGDERARSGNDLVSGA